jgi:hypothetical protein
MPLTVKPFTLAEFVQRLETDPGFSFARYGDGTFFCLRGYRGVDCDQAIIHGDQAEILELTIRDTSITHGIGDLALSEGRAAEWLEQKGIDIPWYDCNVLHNASIRGQLNPFVRLVRKRKTLIIGPEHLKGFRQLRAKGYIKTHPTKAFYEVDELEIKAKDIIPKEKINLVCISAFTAAPVLVSRLHKHFPEVNVLDVGSLWDVYTGRISRKVFRQMTKTKILALRAANFK